MNRNVKTTTKMSSLDSLDNLPELARAGARAKGQKGKRAKTTNYNFPSTFTIWLPFNLLLTLVSSDQTTPKV